MFAYNINRVLITYLKYIIYMTVTFMYTLTLAFILALKKVYYMLKMTHSKNSVHFFHHQLIHLKMKYFNPFLLFFLLSTGALKAQISEDNTADPKFWATGKFKPITISTDQREAKVMIKVEESYDPATSSWFKSGTDTSVFINNCGNRYSSKKYTGNQIKPLRLNVLDTLNYSNNRISDSRTSVYNTSTNPSTLSTFVTSIYHYKTLTQTEPDSIVTTTAAGAGSIIQVKSAAYNLYNGVNKVESIILFNKVSGNNIPINRKTYKYKATGELLSITDNTWDAVTKNWVACPSCENYTLTYDNANRLIEQINNKAGNDSTKYLVTYVGATNRIKTLTNQLKVAGTTTWTTNFQATGTTQNTAGYPTNIDYDELGDSLKIGFTYTSDSLMTLRLITAKTPNGYVNFVRLSQEYCLPCASPTPVVQAQPSSIYTGFVGQQITVGIGVLNTQTVQWQLSTDAGGTWQNISPTDTTYIIAFSGNGAFPYITLKSPKLSQTGYQYRAILSNGCAPPVTTRVGTVSISTCTLPSSTIQTQPANVSANVGANAVINVTATNVQQYNWYYSNDNGAVWRYVFPTDTVFVGQNTNTMTVRNVQASYNAYQFQCRLFNGCAPGVTTNSAILTAVQACTAPNPAILAQPTATITAYVGQTPQAFGIAATNIGSFQWQLSTDNGANWVNITSLDSANYRLGSYGTVANGGNFVTVVSPKLSQNGYKFRVIVSNGCATSVTSVVGTLLVQNCTLNSPTIQTQPTNLTKIVGQNAVFAVTATNAANYEWYYYTATDTISRNFVNPSDTSFTGQSTNTLTLKYAKSSYNDYRFVCTMFNGCAPSTSSNIVKLTVSNCASTVPVIAANTPSSAYADFTAYVGYGINGAGIFVTNTITSAQWQVMVVGDSIWRNILSTDTTYVSTTLPNSAYIGVSYPKLTQNGTKFRVVLSNGCASVTSSAVTMTVVTCPLPALTITTQPTHKTASVASSASFSLNSPTATFYNWRVSKDMGLSWTAISTTDTTYTGAATNTLTVKYVKAVQNGHQFSCLITNGCSGTLISAAAILTVGTSAVNELDAKVKIYPNPASDMLYIETPTLSFKLTLMDSKGTVLNKSENTNQLSVRDLPMGLYFINIKTNSGETTKKIIVGK
jgi:Secretion system C-terminal sorting domain